MKSPTSTPDSPSLFIPDLRPSTTRLPPYLLNTEPMEPADIPLQLALLTMEVRTQREALDRLSSVLEFASRMTTLPGADHGP